MFVVTVMRVERHRPTGRPAAGGDGKGCARAQSKRCVVRACVFVMHGWSPSRIRGQLDMGLCGSGLTSVWRSARTLTSITMWWTCEKVKQVDVMVLLTQSIGRTDPQDYSKSASSYILKIVLDVSKQNVYYSLLHVRFSQYKNKLKPGVCHKHDCNSDNNK